MNAWPARGTTAGLLVIGTALTVSHPASGQEVATALQSGTFTMRLVYRGELVGSAVFEITAEGGALVIRELTMIPGADVDAETVIVVDSRTLVPRSLRTTGVMFEEVADIAMQFADGRMNGYSTVPREDRFPQGELRIDTVLPADVIEWTTAMLMIPTLPLRDRAVFPRTLFDSRNARAVDTSIWVDGRATVTVPAGTFDTFRVKVGGNPPEYVAYVSVETPRRLIKIEDVRTPWVYERMP